MGMIYTCVLVYVMPYLQACLPCIFVINKVTSTSMQSSLCDIVVLYPSMSLFAIMEHPSMTQSCSTFAIKCSWQIVYVFINFAEVVVVDPCML